MAKGNAGRCPVWHSGVLAANLLKIVGRGWSGVHGRRPAVPFAEGDAGMVRVFA